MQTADKWQDYELIDSGQGEKLERWGGFFLSRPDPIAIWPKNLSDKEWRNVDAFYKRNSEGGGKWKINKELPEKWEISYGDLKFFLKRTPFKHTGIFPEQSSNWDIFKKIILQENKPVSILNLFAYTGGATIACAKAGAKICHVDSSKGIVDWAKENAEINKLKDKIRWIVDDAIKFTEREIKRGIKYDGIIMDPPSFGRGSKGEVWKLEEDLWPLVKRVANILVDDPLFFHINSYSTGMSPTTIGNILKSAIKNKGKIETGELGLQEKNSQRILPQGTFGRWSK